MSKCRMDKQQIFTESEKIFSGVHMENMRHSLFIVRIY